MTMLAIDLSDTGGVVVPLAIIAACVLIILVSVAGRRARRRGRDEAAAPDGAPPGATAEPGAAGADQGAAPTDLLAWQSTHGHDVDQWLDAHEGTLPALVPGADPAIDAELDRAMANAAAACPNPDVAAMLAGMRDTATATRAALTADDRPAAEAAHEEYGRHRAGAINALASPPAP